MKKTLICEEMSATLESVAIPETTKKREHVLRTLRGPFSVADYVNVDENRNGRLYSEKLLRERIVECDYTKEMLAAKCLFGEPTHPTTRLDIDMGNISHVVTSLSLKEGVIYGTLDILDTPAGRIINTIVEYGSKIGISSRGAGTILEEGSHKRVNEDDYGFMTYDLVACPGFGRSRVTSVMESQVDVDLVNTRMVQALTKQIMEMTERDRDAIIPLLESTNSPELTSAYAEVKERWEKPTTEDTSLHSNGRSSAKPANAEAPVRGTRLAEVRKLAESTDSEYFHFVEEEIARLSKENRELRHTVEQPVQEHLRPLREQDTQTLQGIQERLACERTTSDILMGELGRARAIEQKLRGQLKQATHMLESVAKPVKEESLVVPHGKATDVVGHPVVEQVVVESVQVTKPVEEVVVVNEDTSVPDVVSMVFQRRQTSRSVEKSGTVLNENAVVDGAMERLARNRGIRS